MKLPDEAIKEFQQLYEKEYGKKLTEAEAREMGTELLQLYALASGMSLTDL